VGLKPAPQKPFTYIVVIGFVLLTQFCRASVVVILRSGDKYWIAVDSMKSNDAGTKHEYVCKIFPIGNFYWTATATPYSDPHTGFSLDNLIKEAESPKSSVTDVAKAFAQKSQKPVADEVTYMRDHYQTAYAELMVYKPANLIKVFFFGIENRQPSIIGVVISAEEGDNREVVIRSSVTDFSLLSRNGDFLTTGPAAIPFVRANRSRIKSDPVGLIRDAVIAEEKADPNGKGGTVAIMEVSSSGVRWISRGECQQKNKR